MRRTTRVRRRRARRPFIPGLLIMLLLAGGMIGSYVTYTRWISPALVVEASPASDSPTTLLGSGQAPVPSTASTPEPVARPAAEAIPKAVAAPAPELRPENLPAPDPKPEPRPDPRPVLILMYHEVAEQAGELAELYVRPSELRAQVLWLKEQGYEAVTLADVARAWGMTEEEPKPLPEKPVVLSFDDGYLSVYTEAFPVLKQEGWPATIYLQVNVLDTPGFLTTDMVKEMQASGFEVGSHTITHADLTKLSPARLESELVESKRELERRFASTVSTFAYPAGRFNDNVIAATKRAGYVLAVTTRSGIGVMSEPLTLRRVRVNRSDSTERLSSRIESLTR